MRRPRNVCLVAAAIAYLLVALWNFRAVLPAPMTLLPENASLDRAAGTLGRFDLERALWTVTGNADRILTRPAALRAEGRCHPLPRAYTLGEHMLGESLLAAVPLALTGDPIAAYNAMLLAHMWIAALAMFLCAYDFTRSAPAAFVAGLVFCLAPGRIADSAHPFLHGDLWAPLALLYLQRTLARGGWWNGLALALFIGLTVLESPSVLLGVLLVLAVYGAWAAWRQRRDVARWLPPLVAAAALVAGLATLVLRPYLVAHATWDVMLRGAPTLTPSGSYAPVPLVFPGWLVLLLIGGALADRARQRRLVDGADPRLALLSALLLAVWCSLRTVPLLGWELPTPLLLLMRVVPGLDAVHALDAVGRVAILPAALLAGYAVLAITERRSHLAGALVAAALSLLLAGERWIPPVAAASFGVPLDLTSYVARPDEADVELLRAHAQGALLDLPHAGGVPSKVATASYLMLDAFRPGPVGTCDSSMPSPLDGQVGQLALALPRAAAIDALVALGFETLLLHADRMEPKRLQFFTDLINVDPALGERLQALGRTERLRLFRMQSPTPPGNDPAQLAVIAPDADVRSVGAGRQTLEISFANTSPRTYAQRRPLAPLPIEARWRDASGRIVHRERTRALLPIALGPGAQTRLPLALDVPPQPGSYDLTLHLDATSGAPLAWTRVTVLPAAS